MFIETIELTPAQFKAWEDTRVSLLRHCPAFAHILYTLLDNSGNHKLAIFTTFVPIAATDGRNILINPETYFDDFTLNERVFILGHEILHCILNHPGLFLLCKSTGKVIYPNGKSLPFIPMLMNKAADYVVNPILIDSNVGKFREGWLNDPKIADAQSSVLDAYKKLYKEIQRNHGSGSGEGSGEGQFDEHLAPGTSEGLDPHDANNKRSDTQWRAEISTALSIAKLKGNLPGALERLFEDNLEPRVEWNEHIQAFFARREGPGRYDWRKPDRRLISRNFVSPNETPIYAPAKSSYGIGLTVVGIDTSGSIDEKVELPVFSAELGGIFEQLKPKELWVVWCDAKVHRTQRIEDMADFYSIKKWPGGGGTDFRPVFEWIDDQFMQPDVLVYLTDGLGSFPNSPPPYDVLWGATIPGVRYPFGTVVELPMGRAGM